MLSESKFEVHFELNQRNNFYGLPKNFEMDQERKTTLAKCHKIQT